jgi:hypothetical protein
MQSPRRRYRLASRTTPERDNPAHWLSLPHYRRPVGAEFWGLANFVGVCPPPAPSASLMAPSATSGMFSCSLRSIALCQSGVNRCAIQHNCLLCKVGQSLRRASLGGLPLRALRVRVSAVMSCALSRPKALSSSLLSVVYSGASRIGGWLPRPPPVRPKGAPPQTCKLAIEFSQPMVQICLCRLIRVAKRVEFYEPCRYIQF